MRFFSWLFSVREKELTDPENSIDLQKKEKEVSILFNSLESVVRDLSDGMDKQSSNTTK